MSAPKLVPKQTTTVPPAPEHRVAAAAAHAEPGRGVSQRSRSRGRGWWRKLLAFAGPGYLVAVGYMDPGNWATDLAGGSRFGYTLLSVILLSNLMAVLLQGLASKLGIVTGRDLAQACRDHYSQPVVDRPLGALRDRDRRVRPGRGDRVGDRAQSAVPHPDAVGRRASPRSTCCSCSICRTRDSGCSRRSSSRSSRRSGSASCSRSSSRSRTFGR